MFFKKHWSKILLMVTIAAVGAVTAFGFGSYLDSFTTTYPATASSKLNSCGLCHINPAGGGSRNAYGTAYANNGHSFAAIESMDSDGDGFTNLQEIMALTFPGDATDHPPTADATAPVVTFSIPPTSSSLTVAVTLSATDNVGVTGYFLSESSGVPAAGASGWTGSAPSSYSFGTAGAKTLNAWAKDAAGNVSATKSASTTITLVQAADTTPPTVTFALPAASNSLTVTISMLSATDNVGVTGYRISESSSTPTAGSAGWAGAPPSNYTFAAAGANTLYAWAKDAAGNVSATKSATTNITLTSADTTPPSVTLTLPASSSTLTVSASISASDNVGVTGYFVSESSSTPSAGGTGWTATAPTSHTFGTGGSKTLYAWAKDAAGNISARAGATTDITLPGPTVSGMDIWAGKWFRVTITRKEGDGARSGYLSILSWDETNQVLKAKLYTRHDERWSSVDLSLHYTSGTPDKFFSSFDYAGQYSFTASITGTVDNGDLQTATIRAVGIYHVGDEDDDHDEEVNRTLTISGSLVPASSVPGGITSPRTRRRGDD